ncbi:Uncharacterised protein [Mycobacteroides abscessus subsp. abscessus]|nr:Uncharacterised protein [Mycobacteroides abscessus subsp. abscessus]
MVLQGGQHGSECDQADHGPQHLLRGVVVTDLIGIAVVVRVHQIQPMDHHQAESVEQCDARQQQRIGIRSPATDRHVRQDEKHEVGEAVSQQVPGQPALKVGLDENQGHRGDGGCEAEEPQLRATSC